MLILYFYVFQRGFEVLNKTFQASVYVTIITLCIMIYATVTKSFHISLVVELLISSKKMFPI